MKQIIVTTEEKQLFDFLLDVVDKNQCQTVIRVAGGWVRDKLLGRNSDDIDIVLDNMTGKKFADLINRYEVDHGHQRHAVGLIKANPDQSKHLETATMQLGAKGNWVDLVNLRCEAYSSSSRIPSEMTFGTPEQDAERRDFTINSLFFNLRAEVVEDWTGVGLEDLARGLLRTPLDPHVTFLDDPIRVLRAIRFAARFDFDLTREIRDSMARDDVKLALEHKVSRERVGKEIMGMLMGSQARPERACRLLYEHNLSQIVFQCPVSSVESTELTIPQIWTQSVGHVAKMQYLLDLTDASEEGSSEVTNTRLRLLAAILLPMARLEVQQKKKKRVAVPHYILKESLKVSWICEYM